MKNAQFFRSIIKIQFFLIIFANFFLFGETPDKTWLNNIWEQINHSQKVDSEIKTSLVKYSIIMHERGEVSESLKIFNMTNHEIEKSDFISYCLSKYRKIVPHDKQILSRIKEELQILNLPMFVKINHYIDLAYCYLNVKDFKELKKMIEFIKTVALNSIKFCNYKAKYLSDIYYLCRSINFIKESEKILDESNKVFLNCFEKNKFSEQKYAYYIHFIDKFIELGNKEKILDCIEKVKSSLKSVTVIPETNINIMIKLIRAYLSIGDTNSAFNLLICSFKDCYEKNKLAVFIKAWETLSYFKREHLISFLDIIKGIIKKQEIKEINQKLWELLVHINVRLGNYNEAYRVSNSFKDEMEKYSEYMVYIAYEEIRSSNLVKVTDRLNKIPNNYYKISLCYNIAKYYIHSERNEETRKILNKALVFSKQLKSKKFVRIPFLDQMAIGELYWKIGDLEGLTNILNVYKSQNIDHSVKENIAEIQKWMIDILLKKNDIKSTLKVLSEIKIPTYKSIGNLYLAEYFFKRGETENADKYFTISSSIITNSKPINLDLVLSEYFRLFIKKTKARMDYRVRDIKVGHF